jgi:two-component system NtrC family sensor kinase
VDEMQVPRRPAPDSPRDQAVLTRAVQHTVEVETDPRWGPSFREQARSRGFRSALAVPMLHGTEAVGAIAVTRAQVGGFTIAEIGLLQTFADQAAIALENARLLTELRARNADLTEALEQQTATSEVLRVISRSPTDVQPVFDAIVESAVRLCETMAGALLRFNGETLHPAAVYGPAREEILRAWEGFFPYRPGPEVAIGQAVLERRVINIEDVMSLPRNPLREATQRSGGYRAYLAVPMLHEGDVIGVIASWRAEPRAFSDRQVRLMQTFADQAVIAIENVRLFKELEERNGELRVALEQQTATSELLKVIGRSTFDLLPVFETLAENAVRLCGAERALVYRFDGEALRVVATHNVSPEIRAFVEQNPIAPGQGSTSARAALQRRTVHVHDIQADPEYAYGARQIDATRTMVAVPMLRMGELLGVITIYRLEVQPFTESQIALMETFADQAAIAIENARLLTRAAGQERRPHRGPGAADGHRRDPARDLGLADGCPAGLRHDRAECAPPV